MRSSSHTGRRKGNTDCSQTFDKECNGGHRQKALYIVGIGPGSIDHLTHRAVEVLKSVDSVVGYTTYIDLIGTLIEGKNIISTPMTKEVERVQAALDIALTGKPCAIVSSGDPGIYAMAGLVFEMCQANGIAVKPPFQSMENQVDDKTLRLEVVPGIPALCAGASLLGAPLTHDFAVISLSDLLTPWEIIENRLDAAARADFVIVLYNPKSKRRSQQLEKAQKIILKHRDKHTPTGVVISAMRENQEVFVVSLEELHQVPANMQTTVFIGSSKSSRYLDFMLTPRGYADKYTLYEKK